MSLTELGHLTVYQSSHNTFNKTTVRDSLSRCQLFGYRANVFPAGVKKCCVMITNEHTAGLDGPGE